MSDIKFDEELHHYQELHKTLDEILAYFIKETGILPSKASALDILKWLHKKTREKIKGN